MAYYAPSMFDLMNPYGDPPPSDQMYGDTVEPVKPSRMDTFTDRMVGSDRYQELDDQARRRALGQAMMSLGQSLAGATGAYINADYGNFAQILGQAIPRARGDFEKRLGSEEEYRQGREDRAFQGEQREYQREKMGDERTDRKRSDADRKAQMDASLAGVSQAEKKLTEFASGLPKTPETEVVIADARAKVDLLKRTAKSGVPLTPQQMAQLEGSFDKIYELSPDIQRAKMDREQGENLYKAAKIAGRSVEEEVSFRQKMAGIELRSTYVNLAIAEQNQAIGKERLAQEKEQTKFMQGGGGQIPVGYVANPATGGIVRDPTYVRPAAPKAAVESPAMKRAKTNDSLVRVLARPDELVSEEALGSLQELGIPAVVDQPLSPEAHERLRSVWYAAPAAATAGIGSPPSDNAPMPSGPVPDKAATWAKAKGYFRPDGSLDLERAASELKRLGYQ